MKISKTVKPTKTSNNNLLNKIRVLWNTITELQGKVLESWFVTKEDIKSLSLIDADKKLKNIIISMKKELKLCEV